MVRSETLEGLYSFCISIFMCLKLSLSAAVGAVYYAYAALCAVRQNFSNPHGFK